ncbi:hypothetical protein TrRE_jg13348 [Triparma retinervis]|uniref:Uncharacterized protein n=1 Tax=Triparma retinervis TaxID=2557542 RepID=A0A9W7ED81_9STRA|nr:hypothetical protein TrRE_jg13348 [Triparma retinervis]
MGDDGFLGSIMVASTGLGKDESIIFLNTENIQYSRVRSALLFGPDELHFLCDINLKINLPGLISFNSAMRSSFSLRDFDATSFAPLSLIETETTNSNTTRVSFADCVGSFFRNENISINLDSVVKGLPASIKSLRIRLPSIEYDISAASKGILTVSTEPLDLDLTKETSISIRMKSLSDFATPKNALMSIYSTGSRWMSENTMTLRAEAATSESEFIPLLIGDHFVTISSELEENQERRLFWTDDDTQISADISGSCFIGSIDDIYEGQACVESDSSSINMTMNSWNTNTKEIYFKANSTITDGSMIPTSFNPSAYNATERMSFLHLEYTLTVPDWPRYEGNVSSLIVNEGASYIMSTTLSDQKLQSVMNIFFETSRSGTERTTIAFNTELKTFGEGDPSVHLSGPLVWVQENGAASLALGKGFQVASNAITGEILSNSTNGYNFSLVGGDAESTTRTSTNIIFDDNDLTTLTLQSSLIISDDNIFDTTTQMVFDDSVESNDDDDDDDDYHNDDNDNGDKGKREKLKYSGSIATSFKKEGFSYLKVRVNSSEAETMLCDADILMDIKTSDGGNIVDVHTNLDVDVAGSEMVEGGITIHSMKMDDDIFEVVTTMDVDTNGDEVAEGKIRLQSSPDSFFVTFADANDNDSFVLITPMFNTTVKGLFRVDTSDDSFALILDGDMTSGSNIQEDVYYDEEPYYDTVTTQETHKYTSDISWEIKNEGASVWKTNIMQDDDNFCDMLFSLTTIKTSENSKTIDAAMTKMVIQQESYGSGTFVIATAPKEFTLTLNDDFEISDQHIVGTLTNSFNDGWVFGLHGSDVGTSTIFYSDSTISVKSDQFTTNVLLTSDDENLANINVVGNLSSGDETASVITFNKLNIRDSDLATGTINIQSADNISFSLSGLSTAKSFVLSAANTTLSGLASVNANSLTLSGTVTSSSTSYTSGSSLTFHDVGESYWDISLTKDDKSLCRILASFDSTRQGKERTISSEVNAFTLSGGDNLLSGSLLAVYRPSEISLTATEASKLFLHNTQVLGELMVKVSKKDEVSFKFIGQDVVSAGDPTFVSRNNLELKRVGNSRCEFFLENGGDKLLNLTAIAVTEYSESENIYVTNGMVKNEGDANLNGKYSCTFVPGSSLAFRLTDLEVELDSKVFPVEFATNVQFDGRLSISNEATITRKKSTEMYSFSQKFDAQLTEIDILPRIEHTFDFDSVIPDEHYSPYDDDYWNGERGGAE